MVTICFTGQQATALCGFDKSKYTDFVSKLSAKLEETCNRIRDKKQDRVRFLSGGWQAFDQLAFWAVNSLSNRRPDLYIRNIVYIPFKGLEKEWREEGLFGQKQYQAMLRKASKVVFLHDELTDKQAIANAFVERNHAMVDKSSYVVALYAGDDWKNQASRECECMRYAFSQQKTIAQIKYGINPEGLQMVKEWSILLPIRKKAA